MKKMKRYEAGGDIDPLEAANKSEESQSIADEAKGDTMLKAMRDQAAKPKAKPAMPALSANDFKAAPSKPKSTQTGASVPTIGASGTYGAGLGRRSHPEYPEDASKAMADMKKSSPDMTKMSVSDRMKASREKSRSGSGATDTRSVNERFRSALGFAKGGSVSASTRADGIAQRGKTRGKMC